MRLHAVSSSAANNMHSQQALLDSRQPAPMIVPLLQLFVIDKGPWNSQLTLPHNLVSSVYLRGRANKRAVNNSVPASRQSSGQVYTTLCSRAQSWTNPLNATKAPTLRKKKSCLKIQSQTTGGKLGTRKSNDSKAAMKCEMQLFPENSWACMWDQATNVWSHDK